MFHEFYLMVEEIHNAATNEIDDFDVKISLNSVVLVAETKIEAEDAHFAKIENDTLESVSPNYETNYDQSLGGSDDYIEGNDAKIESSTPRCQEIIKSTEEPRSFRSHKNRNSQHQITNSPPRKRLKSSKTRKKSKSYKSRRTVEEIT